MNHRGQRIVQAIGLIAAGFGVKTMLDTPTMILPPWFLVLLFLPITFGISFVFALLTRVLTKDKMTLLSLTSIYLSIISLSFYISEFKPTYKITVQDKFVGQVKIFLSKEDKDDFELNEFGIGYISKDRIKKAFIPQVIKDGKDITTDITNLTYGDLGWGSVDGKVLGPYKYLGFTIPGQPSDSLGNDLPGLIEHGAIDTTRMLKGN